MRPKLKAILYRHRIPVEDTEDLIQETLLTLVRRRLEIRDPEAWVIAVLKKKCLMYWRARRRRLYRAVEEGLLDVLAAPQAPPTRRIDLERDFGKLLHQMPSRCQDLIRLRFALGFNPREIAERLGYRISSISKITQRCLAALTRELLAAGYCRSRE